MSTDLGYSISLIALAMSIGMLTTAISLPVIGILADKYGPRIFILFGTIFAAISTVLIGLVSSIWQLYLLYGCIIGFTLTSCCHVIPTVLIAKWFVDKKDVALTIFQSAFPFGWVLTSFVMGYLLTIYSWRTIWLVVGATFSLMVISLIPLIREPMHAPSSNGNNVNNLFFFKRIMKTRFFIVLGIISQFLCGFTDVPFSMLWVPLSIDWGFREITASYALGFVGVMALIGTFIFGPLPEKLGFKKPLVICYSIRAFSLVLSTFLFRFSWAYFAFSIFMGLSFFGMAPVIQAWFSEIFGEKIGGLVGFSMLIHNLGAATGIYFYSLIAEVYETYWPIFPLSLTLSVVIVIICCCLLNEAT